jgi:hypothetical protein
LDVSEVSINFRLKPKKTARTTRVALVYGGVVLSFPFWAPVVRVHFVSKEIIVTRSLAARCVVFVILVFGSYGSLHAQGAGGTCAKTYQWITIQLSCGSCSFAQPAGSQYGFDLFWPYKIYECCGGARIGGIDTNPIGPCYQTDMSTPDMRRFMEELEKHQQFLVASCDGSYSQYGLMRARIKLGRPIAEAE